jgi:hypothetical protein
MSRGQIGERGQTGDRQRARIAHKAKERKLRYLWEAK